MSVTLDGALGGKEGFAHKQSFMKALSRILDGADSAKAESAQTIKANVRDLARALSQAGAKTT